MSKKHYEWDSEEWTHADRDHIDAEVVDHHHYDKLSEIPDYFKTDLHHIVLVYDKSDEYEGVIERGWAYPTEGRLPEFFVDAYGVEINKVPQRFHQEYARYITERVPA